MAFLPIDMILEILCRLGVKDLLRFRCLSKSWCSFIEDPYFIKLHLSHAANRSDLVECDSLNELLSNCKQIESTYNGHILGCCNGLVALFKGRGVNNDIWLDEILLCNPSTRESRMLPSVEINLQSLVVDWLGAVYGFGYDPISDDYKLIRMIKFQSLAPNIMVYSLRTNSWRSIKDFPSDIEPYPWNGILVNNALHWLASKKLETDTQCYVVVAFDLVVEKYRVIELPDCKDKVFCLYVKAIDGCLCLIADHDDEVLVSRTVRVYDIWMMKQYGLKQSWTKLISVPWAEFADLCLRNKRVVGNVRIRDLLGLNVVESLVPVTRM